MNTIGNLLPKRKTVAGVFCVALCLIVAFGITATVLYGLTVAPLSRQEANDLKWTNWHLQGLVTEYEHRLEKAHEAETSCRLNGC